MVKEVNVLIVGAGPGGLAIAGRLRKKGIDFHIIEKSNRIANAWYHHYDRLHLHTVKEYSHLPFKPFPKKFPTYVSKFQLFDYYQEYAKEMNISPDFNTEATEIKKKEGGWIVNCKNGNAYKSNKVVLATGVNCIPIRPQWPDKDKFKGILLHSIEYKRASDYKDKRVLVIGMGNTGAEIALDLAEQGVEVFISIRGDVNIVPRDVAGRPTHITALKLAFLPVRITDWIGNMLQKITIGDLRKYGINTPKLPPAKQLREFNKTPVIDLGTVAMIKKDKIKVIGDIQEFYEEGVITKKGEKLPFDIVVMATGFKANASDLVKGLDNHLNSFGLPRDLIGRDELEGLYFLGYNSNKQGGILGVIINDSGIIAEEFRS